MSVGVMIRGWGGIGGRFMISGLRSVIGGRMMGVLRGMHEGVLVGVLVQLVQGNSFATVNLVPELASKLILIKESTIGAHEPGTLGPITSVIAHTVYLTSSLGIGIHARLVRSVSTVKLGVWRLSIAGIILAGNAGNSVLIVVVVMVGVLVIWLRFVVGSWLMIGRLRGMIGSRFMVSGLWSVIRGWFMICRSRRAIRSRLVISRSRRAVRRRLVISGLRSMVRGWFMVGRLSIGSRLVIGTGVGRIGLLRCVGCS